MAAVPATRFSEQDLNDAIFAAWIERNMGFAFNSIEEAIDRDEFPYGHEYDEFVEAVDEYGYDAPYVIRKRYTQVEIARAHAESRDCLEHGRSILTQADIVISHVRVGLVGADQYEALGAVDSPIQVHQAGYAHTSPRYYLVALKAH